MYECTDRHIAAPMAFVATLAFAVSVLAKCQSYTSGPGCSKLTMSLVNVSLKFQMLISNITQYFLLKQCEKLLQCKNFSHFFNKKISVFSDKVVKYLMS